MHKENSQSDELCKHINHYNNNIGSIIAAAQLLSSYLKIN